MPFKDFTVALNRDCEKKDSFECVKR